MLEVFDNFFILHHFNYEKILIYVKLRNLILITNSLLICNLLTVKIKILHNIINYFMNKNTKLNLKYLSIKI